MINFEALQKIQYGMYVITTAHEDEINGQIATVLFQVTSNPVQIAICLSKNTYTHELISQSKIFGASILKQDTPMKFIGTFGYRCGRDCLKFSGVKYKIGENGSPLVLDNSLAVLEAEVGQVLDVGTHTLFVGEVKNSEVLCGGVAMTYEYYHTVYKGKSPENAPTFIG